MFSRRNSRIQRSEYLSISHNTVSSHRHHLSQQNSKHKEMLGKFKNAMLSRFSEINIKHKKDETEKSNQAIKHFKTIRVILPFTITFFSVN